MTDVTLIIDIIEISIGLARLSQEGKKLILITIGIFIIFIILLFALTNRRR